MKKLCVHRKGATRAFPAGHGALPARYKSVGQPVLIPGDMGCGSYVLVGQEKAMEDTFGSACHGAGRVMSRTQAIKVEPGTFNCPGTCRSGSFGYGFQQGNLKGRNAGGI